MPDGFPDSFLWGVAAASIQIEGAVDADGRAPSVWDALSQQPGGIFEGHTPSVACDHYHRYQEDVALMADLGVKGYRLSLAWPRILPNGAGAPNDAGLDFYDRLIDALLDRKIQPWVTLFHWDFPLALFHRGGWLNRESVDWFGNYTEVVARRLGDRVKHWMTHNEPQVFIGLGHRPGPHAPKMNYAEPDTLRAAHHALLAHGRAVEVLRSTIDDVRCGWAPHITVPFPVTNEEPHISAARQAFFDASQGDWCFNNAWFADPVLLGAYPTDGLSRLGHLLPKGFEADLPKMHQPLDFFGANIYQGRAVRAADDGTYEVVPRLPGYPHTMFHWPFESEVLYWGPRFIHERYELPVYITENGCASMDWVHADGKVHDAPRIDLLARMLTSLRQAVADGVDVRGYFHWSLMDNFEWAEGYRMRFGLVYVDYQTLERIPKDSYSWYQQVILSNGGCLPENVARLR